MRKVDFMSFKVIVIMIICFIGLTLPGTAQETKPTRGWWPQSYTVERDNAAGRLVLTTPYYTFSHDLKKGGVLTQITLTHGKVDNLILEPMESRVKLMMEAQPDQAGRGGRSRDVFSDSNDPAAKVNHTKTDEGEIVTVEASLLGREGEDSGIKVKTTYRYRWGYVKIHKEFQNSGDPVKLRNVCVLSTLIHPSLTDYGFRPAVSEEMGNSPHSWQNGQIRRWGKIRPGTHFDLPFRTRYVPRYLVLANQGVEGLEWFQADDLSQWDYQTSGEPGTGYCELTASTNPLGIRMSVFPLSLSDSFLLPTGGFVEMKDSFVFDYYIGVPILEGHAYNPWLNQSYRANKGDWVSEEEINKNAEDGIVTMHLHNDGDSNRDGLFWKDGSYPPYPPEEMAKMDKVIAAIHANGMKTAPYFSNHELHQSTEEFKKFGEEWGRKPDDQGSLRPNFYYGAHMCLKSGWLDFFKSSVDRVLKNHDFDGVYYDWNIALYCNNPLHMGQVSNGVSGEKGLGTYAMSPTGHWDIDELIDMVEWTRQRVGHDGIVILHNTLAPMFVTENFANYIVGMEFSYGRLSVSMPRPNELPLEWNFVGARPRAVIGYGTIARGAPERILQLHAITTLMTSVAPWPASNEAIAQYKILKPLGNLEQYKFEDYRNEAVRLDDGDCISAVYSREGESFVLVANLEPETKDILCTINPEALPFPISSPSSVEILGEAGSTALDAAKMISGGQKIPIQGDSVVLIRVK